MQVSSSSSPLMARRLVALALTVLFHANAALVEAAGSVRGVVSDRHLSSSPAANNETTRLRRTQQCPLPAPIGEVCPPQTPLHPVACTAAREGTESDTNAEEATPCHYHHMCDALSAGYKVVQCVPALTGRALEESVELQANLDKANSILLSLNLNNTKRVKRVFRRYNVSDEDAPYVLQLAQSLQDEQKNSVTMMGADSSTDSIFVNQPLVMIPVPTPALGGAWSISDIVVGVGCGLGLEFGVRYGKLELRPDYFRTSEICQYQMNSFSFIVGYTNINLFKGGTWVGTYHSGGVGIGSYFATGAAFFCDSEGQDPLDCLAN